MWVRRVERICDCAIRLEAFAGSDKETNPIYQDYHGECGAINHIINNGGYVLMDVTVRKGSLKGVQ